LRSLVEPLLCFQGFLSARPEELDRYVFACGSGPWSGSDTARYEPSGRRRHSQRGRCLGFAGPGATGQNGAPVFGQAAGRIRGNAGTCGHDASSSHHVSNVDGTGGVEWSIADDIGAFDDATRSDHAACDQPPDPGAATGGCAPGGQFGRIVTGPRTASFPAMGTTATVVVTDPRCLDQAVELLAGEIEAVDWSCSRFRPDSEIANVNSAAGTDVAVTTLFLDAVEVGLRAAIVTDGVVDPTVGTVMRIIGYDRTFARVAAAGPAISWDLRPVPGWQVVEVDPVRSTVKVPVGTELDLGATAKALCADRAAVRLAASLGSGVLVSLGGDISVAGSPPGGGWVIQLSDNHADPFDNGGPTVSVFDGGLATSSTTVRRWKRGDVTYHHLVDPRTGEPAQEHWRTVTVAAASCVDANIASTAAVVLGQAAVGWLEDRHLPARLVHVDGDVTTAGGWPAEPLTDGSPR